MQTTTNRPTHAENPSNDPALGLLPPPKAAEKSEAKKSPAARDDGSALQTSAESIHENLVFIICTPRSGSTLLQRMIGSHSAVFTHPEPHLITPMNYLGYYHTVDKAPYDHINAAQALREFVEELPRGEEDYLDALRAYASTIYGRVLAERPETLFLDKTPAYGLIVPFLTKLYPRAKYVVLTRHPMAISHSVAHSFFSGDYRQAGEQSPIVRDYVPALGWMLREKPVPFVHVRYEDIVSDPEAQMRKVADYLGLPFEMGMVNYGEQKHITKSYGDPMSVEKHARPVTSSKDKWVQDLAARPEVLKDAQRLIDSLDPKDLEAWGYPKEEIFSALEGASGKKTKVRKVNAYTAKRKMLLLARRTIRGNILGQMVRKLRYVCDVLLRE